MKINYFKAATKKPRINTIKNIEPIVNWLDWVGLEGTTGPFILDLVKDIMVPPSVIVHTCASWDGLGSFCFLKSGPTNTVLLKSL